MVKYSLSPKEIPRAKPKGFPKGSIPVLTFLGHSVLRYAILSRTTKEQFLLR